MRALCESPASRAASSCIDCGLCPSTAPSHFRRDDEIGQSFVFRQPETAEEIALCREALEGCPTESIGEDGGDT
ncbi:MAG: ferredoxin [Prosthecobacter sp.]|uniref:ferredoxin n=1 Tax=Prosthecobacter sp. TaxID=1965333 RepID=UPI003901010F